MENNLAIQNFKKLDEEFVELVHRIPESQREEVLFDKWSLKDILAHLAAWNDLNTLHTKQIQNDEELEWVEGSAQFNETEIDKRKNNSWNEVYNEFVKSVENLIATFENLPPEIWDKKGGPENRFSPRIFLDCACDHYINEHIPQLKKRS